MQRFKSIHQLFNSFFIFDEIEVHNPLESAHKNTLGEVVIIFGLKCDVLEI